jgi:hypothetical protein
MSAALVTWGGDAMPEGVTITPGAPALLTEHAARRLTDTIRRHLETAAVGLVRAWHGQAHVALGYGEGFEGWTAYTDAEFGDLRLLKLPTDDRRELVRAMDDDGWTLAEIARGTGRSKTATHYDLKGRPSATDPAGGKTAGAATGDDEPARGNGLAADPTVAFAGLSARWEALARVAAQADRGLTSIELDAELEAPLGTATGSLSKLAARGLIELGSHDEARANRRPYRITEAGAERLAEILAAREGVSP